VTLRIVRHFTMKRAPSYTDIESKICLFVGTFFIKSCRP